MARSDVIWGRKWEEDVDCDGIVGGVDPGLASHNDDDDTPHFIIQRYIADAALTTVMSVS